MNDTLSSMRIIGHLDMDAFFAAVEERNNPRFKGLPIAIGADPEHGTGRGIVSTANYKAREYGLHSAQPITRAWRLSSAAAQNGQPPVIFLPGNFSAYSQVSTSIMTIIKHHAPNMQKRSVDEAYFDLTFTGSYKKAIVLCQAIKQKIADAEQLVASVGIGPNKLIAKIASDYDKPNGFKVVRNHEVSDFLTPLPIRSLPGIGPKAATILQQHHIYTIKDLQQASEEKLHQLFGKWGVSMYHKAHGHDTSPIREFHIAKSIGRNRTFHQDTLNSQYIIDHLNAACQDVHNRLITEDFSEFRTIVLTVRFADFITRTRSHTLSKSTNSLPKLQQEIIRLFLPFLDHRENPNHKLIRLVGVRLEKIS